MDLRLDQIFIAVDVILHTAPTLGWRPAKTLLGKAGGIMAALRVPGSAPACDFLHACRPMFPLLASY
ncbi:hypothetical protein F506_07860 [Herbaspirillum hiltneri N3]|uniref:Uncharacterized protein n=1 Tax=Herbaspirillum hiltneri N3 TaxID=1262470 RepID=A0ABM5UZH2_9BURK|nr:hypothetical protein F506_07860 [Herbaspirillum hiltneri N3]